MRIVNFPQLPQPATRAPSCHVMSCHVMSCHVMSCQNNYTTARRMKTVRALKKLFAGAAVLFALLCAQAAEAQGNRIRVLAVAWTWPDATHILQPAFSPGVFSYDLYLAENTSQVAVELREHSGSGNHFILRDNCAAPCADRQLVSTSGLLFHFVANASHTVTIFAIPAGSNINSPGVGEYKLTIHHTAAPAQNLAATFGGDPQSHIAATWKRAVTGFAGGYAVHVKPSSAADWPSDDSTADSLPEGASLESAPAGSNGNNDWAVKINGLAAGGEYDVRVGGWHTHEGERVGGAFSGAVTILVKAPPGKPAVTGAAADADSIALAWNAVADTVDGYKIRWAKVAPTLTYLNSGGAAGMDIPDSAPGEANEVSYTISNLDTATTYEVQVAAVKDGVAGAWSDAARAVTFVAAQKPALNAPQTGQSTLQFSWSAPADSGSAVVTGYKIRWAKSAAPNDFLNANREHGLDIPGALTFSYTITGLDSATTYRAQVAAVTAAAGAWSDVVTANTRFFHPDVNVSTVSERGAPDWRDGILITRYLFGYSEGALRNGLPIGPFGEANDAGIIANILPGITSGELDVDGDGAVTGADAILLTRFLLGVEDESLTEGVADDGDRAEILARIRGLSRE